MPQMRFRFADMKGNYFDPGRFMPFGGGPRQCIGNRLALMELKTAAVHLLLSCKFKKCAKTPVSFKTFLISLKIGFAKLTSVEQSFLARKQGNNRIGSVHPSVHPFVCLSELSCL